MFLQLLLKRDHINNFFGYFPSIKYLFYFATAILVSPSGECKTSYIMSTMPIIKRKVLHEIHVFAFPGFTVDFGHQAYYNVS